MRDTMKKAESAGSALRIRRIGNSAGVILPKDLMARLDWQEGDTLFVVDGAERSLKLTPYDPKHAKALDIARRSFRAYANTYKALAE